MSFVIVIDVDDGPPRPGRQADLIDLCDDDDVDEGEATTIFEGIEEILNLLGDSILELSTREVIAQIRSMLGRCS